MNGVLVNVVQPGEIGFLKSQFGLAKVKPDLAAFLPIQPIQLASGVGVQMLEELAEICRIGKTARDDVVVVGEYSPRFKLPMILAGQLHQLPLKQVKAGPVNEE